MKLLIKPTLLVLITVFIISCSTSEAEDIAPIDTNTLVIPKTKTIEKDILELINSYRMNNGLNPLKSKIIIKSTAYSHTGYMVDKQKVSHDNFLSRSNYLKKYAAATRVSENVAFGYTSASSVVNAWISSESHKSNIKGDYTDFEISAEKDLNGKWYYTNIFIKK